LIHDITVENSNQVKSMVFSVRIIAIGHVVGNKAADGELANSPAFRSLKKSCNEGNPSVSVSFRVWMG
jgi:hypothetical protein